MQKDPYDQPYMYWMKGFNSTDHGLSGMVPTVHKKWPIRTDRLIRSAIRTAWKDQGLSRLVHQVMKNRRKCTDKLIWSALIALNGGFNSTDHGLPGLVPLVHEKLPIRTDRLIRSAICTAMKDQGLSRLVHEAMKNRLIHTDRLIWSAFTLLNERI